MISEKELIKHKWKYIPESKYWRKLGVTFRDVDRISHHYSVYFSDTLSSYIHASTLYELERHIKMGISTIFDNKKFRVGLPNKQKRTLKNWIL